MYMLMLMIWASGFPVLAYFLLKQEAGVKGLWKAKQECVNMNKT